MTLLNPYLDHPIEWMLTKTTHTHSISIDFYFLIYICCKRHCWIWFIGGWWLSADTTHIATNHRIIIGIEYRRLLRHICWWWWRKNVKRWLKIIELNSTRFIKIQQNNHYSYFSFTRIRLIDFVRFIDSPIRALNIIDIDCVHDQNASFLLFPDHLFLFEVFWSIYSMINYVELNSSTNLMKYFLHQSIDLPSISVVPFENTGTNRQSIDKSHSKSFVVNSHS